MMFTLNLIIHRSLFVMFCSKIRRKCQKRSKLSFWYLLNYSTQNFFQFYVSLAPRISFLTVNQPFEIIRRARQYDISLTFITFLNKSTQRVYDAERHFHLNECITVYMSELRKIQLNK